MHSYDIYFNVRLLRVIAEEPSTSLLFSVNRILKNGWLDRHVLQLKAGDKITPLFFSEQEKEVKGETFTLQKAPVLQDKPLPDDTYAFAFRFTTARKEAAASETIHFVVSKGKMSVVK